MRAGQRVPATTISPTPLSPRSFPPSVLLSCLCVHRRLGNARSEVQYGWDPGNFDKVVVNHVVKDAYEEIKAYIAHVYNDKAFLQASHPPPPPPGGEGG